MRIGLVAGAVAAGALLVAGCGGDDGVALPEGTPDAVEEVVVFARPTWGMASDGASLWVQTDDEGAERVDLASGEIAGQAPGVVDLEFGSGRLWASTDDRVEELNPLTGGVRRSRRVPGIGFLSLSQGALWSYRWGRDDELASVLQLDPDTLRVVRELPVTDCLEPREILYAFASVWIACKGSGHVLRVVPSRNRVIAAIETGAGPHHLVAGAGSVWVTNYKDDTVSRIDPATNEAVATVAGVGAGIGMAFTKGSLWAAGTHGLGKIDPASNRVVEEVPLVELGDYYPDLVPVEDSLWVSTLDRQQAWRIPLSE